MSKSRAWLFTLNNPANNELALPESARYLVYQLESGESGTPHLQGYILYSNAVRLASVRTFLPRAHWEKRRGNHKQAKDYCTKEETRVEGPWELGEEPRQGKRNDLEEIKEKINNGVSEREIADTHFSSWIRYHRGFREYRNIRFEHTDTMPSVTVILGPTGTGKSHFARESAGPSAFWKPRGPWWCGYERETSVVIDEFYGWLPWDSLLRICDRYPLRVECKGGSISWNGKDIYITSNSRIRNWYNERIKIEPFIRRVSKFMYIHDRDTRIETDNYNEFIETLDNYDFDIVRLRAATPP